jgi:hypothetical protein
MTVFDDGSGEALYVGGNFTTAGGVGANYIAKWDGVAWSPIGGGMDRQVNAMQVWDDGGGPALFVGGYFSVAGGNSANHVAKWDGTAWSPLAAGVDSFVFSFHAYDDGAGPALYVGGRFDTAGGVAASGMAKWDGMSWSPLGAGLGGSPPYAFALASYDDGRATALYAGGDFDTAGGYRSANLARWAAVGPTITQHPHPQSTQVGQPVTFRVAAAGTGVIAYQWRRDGIDLIDNGRVSGATTDTLTIDPVLVSDAGRYDCIVTDECASEFSNAAALTVLPANCRGDLNGDGRTDLADLGILLGDFGCLPPGPCVGDLNNDGRTDLADLGILLADFGCTP